MTSESERLEILEMIHKGTISPDDGLKLIEAIDESDEISELEYATAKAELEEIIEPVATNDYVQEIDQEDISKIKGWWIIPFSIGVTITVLGGVMMYWAWAAHGIGFGFVAAWIPFLIGIGLLVLGWNSRTGPWIHIRVKQKPGEKPERIAISFPIPNRFFAWSLRTFSSFIPKMNLSGADEILLALGNYSRGDAPLTIDVDEGDNGEKVKIYIG
ncbi:MAG: hypothetical protein J7L35_10120 [Anaerolineales bacterium]|nr:hypothetical protein [Anaerolineales bacterium]